MAERATGTLEPMGPSVTVRFVRHLDAEPAKVWSALTDPAVLRAWLAEAELTPSVGSPVRLVWPDDKVTSGQVLECVEHDTLVYSWDDQRERSLLRFELEPSGPATTLRLAHSGASPDDAPDFGASWQSHLEALDTVLAGGTSTPQDRDARYQSLRPAYQALLAGE